MPIISIRCPCGRQITYLRRKTGEGICQACGNIVSRDEVERQKREQREDR
jgi:transposase